MKLSDVQEVLRPARGSVRGAHGDADGWQQVEAPQGIVVPMLTALHRCCQETRWHPAATGDRSRSGRFSLVLSVINKNKTPFSTWE